MIVAGALLSSFWAIGTVMLLAQERGLTRRRLGKDWKVARSRSRGHTVFRRALLEYLRPGFNPSQNDIDGLAAAQDFRFRSA